MKVVIHAFHNKECGSGHLFRTVALTQALERNNHKVDIVGNIMLRNRVCHQVRSGSPYDFMSIVGKLQPDWLIIDLQEKPPAYIYEIAGDRIKVLNIAGVGRYGDPRANINILQGTGNSKYQGSKWIILRPELFSHKRNPGNSTFVFGGSADRLKLLNIFPEFLPDMEAMLIITPFTPTIPPENENQRVYWPQDESIFRLMARAKQAVTAAGMVVWELVAMGVPTYVFSQSEGHLEFAKRMEKTGLVKAFPTVGLPSPKILREFLATPISQTTIKEMPDQLGAQRVVTLMEEYEDEI